MGSWIDGSCKQKRVQRHHGSSVLSMSLETQGKITYPRSLQHFLKRHAQTTVRKDEALEFTYPVTAVSTFQNA